MGSEMCIRDRCFYFNRGRNHPRDCVKVATSSGQTSNTRNVTWEVEGMPIIAAAPNAGAATGPMPPVPPVTPVLPEPPVLPVTLRDSPPPFPPYAGTGGDPACDDTGDVAGTTDIAAAAGGDAAVIYGGDRQPSGRRGFPGQRAPSTGANTCGNEGVSPSDRYGAAA